MKIGILTYHCVPNFGAQLQAISTVGYLKRKGYEPIVLHWYPRDLEEMYRKRIPSEQVSMHDRFTKEILPLSQLCRNEDELISEIERLSLDAILVGSDALFKYIPESRRRVFQRSKLHFKKVDVLSVEDIKENPFFCDFYDRLKKRIPVCAFSVSSQNCPYHSLNVKEKKTLGKALDNFKEITVRDEWTKGMVQFLTEKNNIKITPDPVFCFNYNVYSQVPSKYSILRKFHLPENYVLLSFSNKFISDEYFNELVQECKRNNIAPVSFPMPEGLRNNKDTININLPLSPLDWYALIMYSKGYIGERMHPIVASIHNSIPFYSFDEYGTNKKLLGGLIRYNLKESSKTYNILDRANFLDHYYSYRNKLEKPSPADVIKKILLFDKNKCEAFSIRYAKYYEESMDIIMKNF